MKAGELLLYARLQDGSAVILRYAGDGAFTVEHAGTVRTFDSYEAATQAFAVAAREVVR